MYHSSSNVFMTNKTPSGVKEHCECAKPEIHQTAKISFPPLSSDRLVQNCVLSHNTFCTKQQHFTLMSTWPHCFFCIFKVSKGTWNHPINNYGFLCDNFLHYLYVLAQSTRQWNTIVTQDRWIIWQGCMGSTTYNMKINVTTTAWVYRNPRSSITC